MSKQLVRTSKDLKRAAEIREALEKDPSGTLTRLSKALVYAWAAGMIGGSAVTATVFLLFGS